MPKSSIPANGNHASPVSRRQLLLGGAGAAAAAAVPPPALAPPAPDEALARLARLFAEALAAYAAAESHRNDCERRYMEEGPDPPAALTRAGPLGRLLKRDWEWWSAGDLVWLMRDRGRRKHWVRARELLPVARAYRRQDRRFARTCGLPAAEAAQAAASDALADLAMAILAMPARSPAALALKAHAVKAWGRPEWWSAEPSHADAYERLAAQVLDAAMGMELSRSPCRGVPMAPAGRIG
jgi:TAT (twin-arginine translocation) pathway signal sequence